MLHISSAYFAQSANKFPERINDILLSNMLRVKPANRGTIDNIDHGLASLLKTDYAMKIIKFLEEFLTTHGDEISMRSLDSVERTIRHECGLLSKVSTRWLLSGNRILCGGIRTIIETAHDTELSIEIDVAELKPKDARHIVFLARKAIGYLFFTPISAASMIISLMKHAPDEQVRSNLGGLLFDPLLINFAGKVRDYVGQRAHIESKVVKNVLDHALRVLDEYLESLRSIGQVPELYPSEAQREAYNRRMARQMAESLKKAESESVFSRLVTKQILLYGHQSINYVYGANGQKRRTVMPLQQHSVEVEIPRQERLDPFGLDYMLRVFRMERLQ